MSRTPTPRIGTVKPTLTQKMPAVDVPPPPSSRPSALPPAAPHPKEVHHTWSSAHSAVSPSHPPSGAHELRFPDQKSILSSPRGDYLVTKVLGHGQFGAVFECLGPFDQVYALKMIRPANRPYAEVQAEWSKEVQRLLSLRHPNVVYIYDAFEDHSLFYLALECCGHPLRAMLGQPMQAGLVTELARQLLAAVQYLHDNDVVHDDLHPGNVLITESPDRPVVKISDFGISEELRGQAAIRPNLVHHAIMAPETLVTGFTTKQSDLYQIGLLMYWMLTGAPAIPSGLSYHELLRFVSDGEPRKQAENICTPLGDLVARLLRRREQYRYTSAREVWSDLRELPSWKDRRLFPVR